MALDARAQGRRRADELRRRRRAASPGRCSTPASRATIRTSDGRDRGGVGLHAATARRCRAAEPDARPRRPRHPRGRHHRRPPRRRQRATSAASRRHASWWSTRCSNDNGEGEDAWIIKALDHIAEQNEQRRRRARDPRPEPQPRRPVRQHRVRLRLLADVRGAAQAVARRRAGGRRVAATRARCR